MRVTVERPVIVVVFRVELLTMLFDIRGEGLGLEILTFHCGGQRRSLLGVVYESLNFLPKRKHRIWFSFLFINTVIRW